MRRLIKKSSMGSFYHGSPLPRALDILESGSINSINSQGEGATQEQNVSLQDGSIYVTTNKQTALSYALSRNSNGWGIIFEMNLDTENDPLTIDEDTFYWGEGLKEDDKNRETFLKMFNNDKAKASEFIKSIVDSGFFNNLQGYDQYDEEYFDMLEEDYIGIDSEGYYYMDLSGLQFGNPEKANEIIRKIPFEDQLKANPYTFAYNGDIDLSKVTNMYLVGKDSEEFVFTDANELIEKYNSISNDNSI